MDSVHPRTLAVDASAAHRTCEGFSTLSFERRQNPKKRPVDALQIAFLVTIRVEPSMNPTPGEGTERGRQSAGEY